ncbi:hypothetical protein [Portibacter marinus]|uniref:hypothetical protein n=1 Tax=Portibacter marinus TaxID=2898660 RepID=UPI001F208B20|nr:hypothetical protein [Portibacter marinus]
MDNVAIIVLLSLVPLWFLSLFLFSRASWSKLAKLYKSTEVFYGTDYGRFDARVNDLNYSSRLYLKYNDEGIYLSVVKRYRPFHPPVFIPWNELVDIRKTDEHVIIEFGNGSDLNQLQVSHKTYEKLEKTLIQYKEQVKASL